MSLSGIKCRFFHNDEQTQDCDFVLAVVRKSVQILSMKKSLSASKPSIEIEAPSAEQIAAANRMRRQLQMGLTPKPSEAQVKKRRAGLEGVVLMMAGIALAFLLHPMGTLGWIIAALPFLGGVIVLMKGWEK